jgi:hypothetical protein
MYVTHELFSKNLTVTQLVNSLQNCKAHYDAHVLSVTPSAHFRPEDGVSKSFQIAGNFSRY